MKIGFKTLNNFILFLFLITIGCKDNENNKLVLPRDFKFKVSEHITELCKNNSSYTGSDFEKQAADYINKQFSEIGLHSQIENFDFESFEVNQSILNIGELSINPTRLCFNPYKDSLVVNADFVLIDTISDTDLLNKYVIVTEKINYFQIVAMQPKMIIYVDSLDYQKIKNQELSTLNLRIKGKINEYKSANVVANIKCEFKFQMRQF